MKVKVAEKNKTQTHEYQYAGLLRTAINQLEYCKVIWDYQQEQRGIYDIKSSLDTFYIRIYNACLIEVIMILCNLLDVKDKRTISFFNYELLYEKTEYKTIIDNIIKLPEFKILKVSRNKIFGHQDISNDSNRFPDVRLSSMISYTLLDHASKIIKLLIEMFDTFAKTKNSSYDTDSFFGTRDSEYEIKAVLKLAKPKLNQTVGLNS